MFRNYEQRSLHGVSVFRLEAPLNDADIRADVEAAGTPIGPLDLLIAAQARSLGATLVSARSASSSESRSQSSV